MKNVLTLAIILILSYSTSFAQDLAGRRIINGNLNFNLINNNNSNQSNFNSNIALLYGKIKTDNTYLALGGRLGISNFSTATGEFEKYSNTLYQVGPSVAYGKFIPLANKFFYAPELGGNITGYFGNGTGVGATINVSPLRFMYHFAENFMFTAQLGSAGLGFQQLNDVTIIDLSSSIANNSGIGVFYTFKAK